METNEHLEPLASEPGLTLNNEAKAYLKEAGRWASFLGILGFIFCGLLLIFSFFAGTIFTRAALVSPNELSTAMAGMGGFITVFYLLIDVLYFFFSLYLYQFGDRIKKGIMFTDNLHVTNAFGKLKSFFKLWGITTIVVLCLYVLCIVGFVIFAIALASHH
jgi:hypothetical protein